MNHFKSNTNKKFSIIIPAFNAANFIHIVLESIRSQTYDNYEIIVVDDCSTDNTNSILSNMTDIILLKTPKNVKDGGARNLGIAHATGEYIIFIDADDFLANNNTLHDINNVIGTEVPDIVYLGFETQTENPLEKEVFIPNKENSTFLERAKSWKYENVWDVCWNREFILSNNLKFIENKNYNDFVFYYLGIICAKSYKYAEFITHIYTIFKNNSISTSKIKEKDLQDFFDNIAVLSKILSSDIGDTTKSGLSIALSREFNYAERLCLKYSKERQFK